MIVLYGVAMNQAAESGDLQMMKDLAAKAEERLAELAKSRSVPDPAEGDLKDALDRLKKEIATLEARKRSRLEERLKMLPRRLSTIAMV